MAGSPNDDALPPHEFDLVVLGSGPAGEKGAAAAAYFGKRVALIEKEDHYGGAAANTGTLPSKTLRETALILSGLRQRQIFGLKFGLERNLRIQDFLLHEHRVKDYERVRIRNNLSGLGSCFRSRVPVCSTPIRSCRCTRFRSRCWSSAVG